MSVSVMRHFSINDYLGSISITGRARRGGNIHLVQNVVRPKLIGYQR